MFIKLTHKNTPVIFNINKIISFRLDVDKDGRTATKVFLESGAHTFVDEQVKVLHKLLNNPTQSLSYEYEVPSIPDRMEEQYNREMQSPRVMEFDRPKRVRQYTATPRYGNSEDRW